MIQLLAVVESSPPWPQKIYRKYLGAVSNLPHIATPTHLNDLFYRININIIYYTMTKFAVLALLTYSPLTGRSLPAKNACYR